MQLFRTQILVRPIPHDEKSPGGVILSGGAKPSYTRGIIVLLGDEVERANDGSNHLTPRDATLKAGDTVLYTGGGWDFDYAGERLKMIAEHDLVGKE